MKNILTISVALTALTACVQPEPEAPQSVNNFDETYCVPGVQCDATQLADNPNSIVLSDETQEQQEISRTRYAELQNQIAQQRVEVTSVTVPTVNLNVNVAGYARSSTNPVGVRAYPRSGGGSGSCNSYSSSFEAQRVFLEKGGPQADPLGLDRDGDGFACRFDPTPYRQLQGVDTRTSPWG